MLWEELERGQLCPVSLGWCKGAKGVAGGLSGERVVACCQRRRWWLSAGRHDGRL